jgi:hypothetical protein
MTTAILSPKVQLTHTHIFVRWKRRKKKEKKFDVKGEIK